MHTIQVVIYVFCMFNYTIYCFVIYISIYIYIMNKIRKTKKTRQTPLNFLIVTIIVNSKQKC